MATTYQYLIVERHGGVERVTLNRPDVRNAFNEHVIADLTEWAARAHSDDSIRVVVIAGAGKVFSAGADAAWMAKMAEYSHEDNLQDARKAAEMFLAINTVPAIVIGRIQGAALGGGSGLAAVCDIVVASTDALFSISETRWGLMAGIILPQLCQAIGLRQVRRYAESELAYQRALTLDPAHLGAHEYLGELMLILGRRDRALHHLQTLERLCGTACEEYLDLRRAYEAAAAPPR